MKIDSISYERRASDGSYGNRALRASATLDEDDNPSKVAIYLCAFVRDHLEREVQAEEAAREAAYQRQREEHARQQEERAREREALIGRDVAITVPAGEDIGEDDIRFDDDEEVDDE